MATEAATLNDKILRQVEYYFSDDSFPFDEFLQSKAEEGSGFVPVELIAGFAKMKALTEDISAITSALEGSDIVTMNEAKDGIARTFAVPEKEENHARIVHVSGFPAGTTEEVVRSHLSKFGEIEHVRMLRNYAADERPLDGSAHVLYTKDSEAEDAVKFMTLMVQIDGSDVAVKLEGFLGWFDGLKKKREGMKRKFGGEGGAKKRKKEIPPMSDDYPRGCLIQLSGFADPSDFTKPKDMCKEFGNVAWVETKNAADGAVLVRFHTAEDATKAKEGLDKKEVDGAELSAVTIDGDAERAYWERKHISTHSQPKGGRRGKRRRRQESYLPWD